jgi:hypothetical protein
METGGFDVLAIRPHYQRLELDYILQRGSVLSTALSKTARAVIRPLGVGRLQVPYWLGQTFVAAKRRPSQPES